MARTNLADLKVLRPAGVALLGMVAAATAGGQAIAQQPAAARPTARFEKNIVAFGSPYATVVAADFDKDGQMDLATAAIEEVVWFSRRSRKSFWSRQVIHKRTAETGTLTSNAMLAQDMDGDGDTDLLAHTGGTGHLAWYENPGAKAEGPWKRWIIDVLKNPHGTAFEDIDKDGRPDLVANQEGSLVWYVIPRKPSGALPASYSGEPGGRTRWERKYLARSGADGIPHSLAFGDVNGDGRRDLCTGASDGGYFAWWERPADGTLLWTRHQIRKAPGATHLIPADINRDGKLDLVTVVGHGKGVSWWSGPDYTAETVIDTSLDGPHSPVLVDIDGDGDLDFASSGRENKVFAWFENDGKGKFTRHELDTAQSGLDTRAADLDGDGDLDLILAGENSRNLVWWENRMVTRSE